MNECVQLEFPMSTTRVVTLANGSSESSAAKRGGGGEAVKMIVASCVSGTNVFVIGGRKLYFSQKCDKSWKRREREH